LRLGYSAVVTTSLAGKLCAVTGGSTGLGAAIADALAAAGASVCALARRHAEGPLPERLPAGQVTRARLDVTDEAAVAGVFAALGGVDVLVACAGTGSFAPLVETTVAELREMLEVHVVGAFLCARAILRQPGDGRVRHIVNVSSVAAFRTFTSSGAYTAAKEGQRGLSRVLTEEARAVGVRVTSLYPGAIDTSMWDGRAGFDRASMLQASDVAGLVVEIVKRPELAVEELVVMPPAGAL
jgi:NAD(P)-dependent dehydrogenase (short-subunit alcohol dehydrogenase family)